MSNCNYSLSALISNLHPQHPPFFLLSAPLHLWMSGEPRPHTSLCMKSNIYSVMELLLKWPPALRLLGGDLANEVIMTCGKNVVTHYSERALSSFLRSQWRGRCQAGDETSAWTRRRNVLRYHVSESLQAQKNLRQCFQLDVVTTS